MIGAANVYMQLFIFSFLGKTFMVVVSMKEFSFIWLIIAKYLKLTGENLWWHAKCRYKSMDYITKDSDTYWLVSYVSCIPRKDVLKKGQGDDEMHKLQLNSPWEVLLAMFIMTKIWTARKYCLFMNWWFINISILEHGAFGVRSSFGIQI